LKQQLIDTWQAHHRTSLMKLEAATH